MSDFDLNGHLRHRNTSLSYENAYLAGERERLETLLAVLLRLAANTTGINPMLILQTCFTIADTDPAIAHIHQ